MESKKWNLKNLIFDKINRKLTLLFMIVGLVAPALGIYYFYTLSIRSMDLLLSTEQAPLLQTSAIMIIILITVDAGIIGFFVSRSISKPIKELYKATNKVEKGNYNIRLDIKSNDEIGKLTNAFNKTTAALGKLSEERKEIDKAKTDFLSITSHELRSPMTPMKAQLQMLEEGYFGKLSKKQKESLIIVIRNADRLDNIIVDFLEISRIEAARLKFNFKETDLTKTIEDTIKFMDGFAKEKKIKLISDLDKIPIIEVDPDRVSQVLRNLINNAIKFSKENSKIEISSELKKDKIEISVRDFGCGLDSQNQIRVFEPFYQVEGSSRRRHGGTGLGLAICRGIVESQNGKIWVESKPNKGSKFSFTIPLEPVIDVKPIKILFSQKGFIEKKIKEEFKSTLGPLGEVEFNELKNKNSLGREDIFSYIDNLSDEYIISEEIGMEFKDHINEIYGFKKNGMDNKNEIDNKYYNEVVK